MDWWQTGLNSDDADMFIAFSGFRVGFELMFLIPDNQQEQHTMFKQTNRRTEWLNRVPKQTAEYITPY